MVKDDQEQAFLDDLLAPIPRKAIVPAVVVTAEPVYDVESLSWIR